MTPNEQVKLLTGRQDDIIDVMLDKAKAEIQAYLKQEYIEELDNVCVDIAIVKLNRLGTEGAVSQSYSGMSESYLDQYPDYIMRQLDAFRKKVHFA